MQRRTNRAPAFTAPFAVMATALLLGSCDFGDTIDPDPDHGGNGGSAELSGTLVFKGGAPATGAWVRVYAASDSSLPMAKGTIAAKAVVDSVQVAADGDFDVTGLADGNYSLLATAEKNDTSFALFRAGITVTGKTSFGTDTLRATGVLTLQATAEENEVQGAVCQIVGAPWSAVSNAEGVCALSGLPPGLYQVTVTHPSFETKVSGPIEISAGGTFSAGELTLLPQAPTPPPSRHFKIFASTVALWTFNSQTANRFQDDGPHSFTLSGSGGYSLVASPFGSALAFGGGPGGILQCAYDDLLAPIETGRLTIEARVRLDAYPVNAGANSKGFVAGMLGGLNLEVTHDGRLQASYSRERAGAAEPSLYTFRSDSMKVPLGSWIDLAVAMDGRPDTAQFYAYLDGVPIQLYGLLNADTLVQYEDNFTVGSNEEGGQPFVGSIDEVRISNSLVLGTGLPLAVDPAAPAQTQRFPVTGSTMALWTFDEYFSVNRIRDLGPHGFHLNRGTVFPLEPSPYGAAAVLQGTTARFTTPYDNRLNIGNTGQLTYEARIFMSQYPSASNFKQRATLMGMYAGIALQIGSDGSIYLKSQKLNGSSSFWYDTLSTAPAAFPLNQWVDIALSVDATVMPSQVYVHVNGVPVQMYGTATSLPFRIYPATFAIGNDETDTQQPFAGKIDEIRVSNTLIHGAGLPLNPIRPGL